MRAQGAAPGAGTSGSGRIDGDSQILTCVGCGSHFRGLPWQQYCRTCWRWRMVGWHLAAAHRALEGMP